MKGLKYNTQKRHKPAGAFLPATCLSVLPFPAFFFPRSSVSSEVCLFSVQPTVRATLLPSLGVEIANPHSPRPSCQDLFGISITISVEPKSGIRISTTCPSLQDKLTWTSARPDHQDGFHSSYYFSSSNSSSRPFLSPKRRLQLDRLLGVLSICPYYRALEYALICHGRAPIFGYEEDSSSFLLL